MRERKSPRVVITTFVALLLTGPGCGGNATPPAPKKKRMTALTACTETTRAALLAELKRTGVADGCVESLDPAIRGRLPRLKVQHDGDDLSYMATSLRVTINGKELMLDTHWHHYPAVMNAISNDKFLWVFTQVDEESWVDKFDLKGVQQRNFYFRQKGKTNCRALFAAKKSLIFMPVEQNVEHPAFEPRETKVHILSSETGDRLGILDVPATDFQIFALSADESKLFINEVGEKINVYDLTSYSSKKGDFQTPLPQKYGRKSMNQ